MEETNKTAPTGASLPAQHLPLTKHYVFNQTGNIMIATTDQHQSSMDEAFRSVCAEVSVFFATMTKAIHSVENPQTKQPYSIYNYAALKKVMDSSGMFVNLHQKEIAFTSNQAGQAFGKDFIQSILDVNLNNVQVPFAFDTLNAIHREAHHIAVAKQMQSNDFHLESTEVSHIIFLCESLLGMPTVSVVVAHFDAHPEDLQEEKPTENQPKKESFFARISQKIIHSSEEKQALPQHQWHYKKDTYLFVAPKFFKNYVNDLYISSTPEYTRFVRSLTDSLKTLK